MQDKLKEGDRDRDIANIKKEIEALECKLLKIDQKYLDDALDHDSYRRLKMHTTGQIEAFQDKIAQLQSIDTHYRTTKMNPAVALIDQFQGELGEKKTDVLLFWEKRPIKCRRTDSNRHPIARSRF